MLLMPYAHAAADNSARAAYLVDMQTGRVLYQKNENEQVPMASTTKVMTALMALELGDLASEVTTSDNAYGRPGTSIYLDRGEKLTLEEMLYGLMIASGNDAAVAIAEHIGGSVDAFCQMMTARAVELGAVNTRFANPNGLPADNHYTTAKDLTIIAMEAMKHPVFREIVSTQRASIPWQGRSYMRVLKNKNALLSTFEGATGIKTGFTRAAGRCLVFGAKREEMEVIGTVLNCPDWFVDAANIMDEAYQSYTWTCMLPDGDVVGTIQVEGGEMDEMPVVLRGALAAPISEEEMPMMRIEIEQSIVAPQPAGMQVGWATMTIDDVVVDQKPLVIADSAKKAPSSFLRWIRCFPLFSGAATVR